MTAIFKNRISFTLLLLVCFATITSCSKKGSTPIPAVDNTPKATITSLSVTTGVYNTEVIIKGTGFSTTLTDNQVFFNNKAATISAATATQLTVTVPLAAGSGTVSIKVSNGAEASGPIFTYQQSWLVSTFAGSNIAGYGDGSATEAKFFGPSGLAFDAAGNLIVAEDRNNDIRKIAPDGTVSTIAGSRRVDKNDGKGTEASFYGPSGVAIDNAGNIYVADYSNNLIRKIDALNNVTTFAGNDAFGFANGKGIAASFSGPSGIKIDAAGNLYVSDAGFDLIRKITPDATVSSFSQAFDFTTNTGSPVDLIFDKDNNLYVSLEVAKTIQKITPAKTITTLAGSGLNGTDDGPGSSAKFKRPFGLTMDKDGNLYVADLNRIRKITSTGQVTTFSGFDAGGYRDGPAGNALFNSITGIAIDKFGNIFVADNQNNVIRKIAFE